MATRSGQHLRERLAGHAGHGTATLATRLDQSRAAAEATMFGDVPDGVRLHLELVARASASPATALPQVIALLVPDDEVRQAAIVAAISSNEPLLEQWERTWEVLRR
jgi:hypothetical protein